jgi:hypothetical protein
MDKENSPRYTVRWTQPYRLQINPELIAMKMLAELIEQQQLEESEYKEANQVIQRIKEKL